MQPEKRTGLRAPDRSTGSGGGRETSLNQLAGFLLARIAEDEEHVYRQWYRLPEPVLARALAECEAKQRLLAHCRSPVRNQERAAEQEYRAVILRLLALPYAGHPDYRREWKL